MYSYISYFFGYGTDEKNQDEHEHEQVPRIMVTEEALKAIVLRKHVVKTKSQSSSFLITKEALKSVVLKKHTEPILEKKRKRPAFARYAPVDSFHIMRLTQKQLAEILNVKLKHVKTNNNKKKWETRHPVLRELKQKVQIVV